MTSPIAHIVCLFAILIAFASAFWLAVVIFLLGVVLELGVHAGQFRP